MAIAKSLKYLKPTLTRLVQEGKTNCYNGTNVVDDADCFEGPNINNPACDATGAGAQTCNANGQGAEPGLTKGCNANGQGVGRICADGAGHN